MFCGQIALARWNCNVRIGMHVAYSSLILCLSLVSLQTKEKLHLGKKKCLVVCETEKF